MKTLILVLLFVASPAWGGGVVLGPPNTQQSDPLLPSEPVSPDTAACILAAISTGLDPSEECEL